MFSRAIRDLEKVVIAKHAARLPALARLVRAASAAFWPERDELEPLASDEAIHEELWGLAISLGPKVIKRSLFSDAMLEEARTSAPVLTALFVDAVGAAPPPPKNTVETP
jgi:hypothetical protein